MFNPKINRILMAHDGIAGSRLRTPWHSHRWESCTLHISRNKLAFIRHTIHALAAHPYPYITTSQNSPPHPITQVLHYPHITPTLPPIPISQIPTPENRNRKSKKEERKKKAVATSVMTVTHPFSPPLRIIGKILYVLVRTVRIPRNWDIGNWYIGKYSKESREAVVVVCCPV